MLHAIYRILVSLTLLGFTGYETVMRLVRQVPWPGYTVNATYAVYLLATLWIIGAIAVWRRTHLARISVGIAITAALIHGILARAGGDTVLGPVFILGAILMGLLLTGILHSEMHEHRRAEFPPENTKLAA